MAELLGLLPRQSLKLHSVLRGLADDLPAQLDCWKCRQARCASWLGRRPGEEVSATYSSNSGKIALLQM